MKKIKKNLITISIIPVLFLNSFVFSCANNNNASTSSDQEIVNTYIKNLNPTIKKDKVNQMANTFASEINTEDLVKTWFDNLPTSNNEINVSFISSIDLGSGVLEIKYLISKNNYSSIYSFKKSGFKIKEDISDQEIVNTYIKNLNPTIKKDKEQLKTNTYAIEINSELKVQEWFDGLPTNNNQIQVSFISSLPDINNESILIINYKIKCNQYEANYSFQELGFKTHEIINPNPNLMNFKQFSEKNSFRLRFGVIKRKYFTNGTAWSWYYKKHSEYVYDWYLMTNFHVIDNVVADTQGLLNSNGTITATGRLEEYYKNNFITNYDVSKTTQFFDLMVYNDQEQFQSIVSAQKRDNIGYSPNMVTQTYIKSLDIITDFKNNNIDLFSKENLPSPYNYYNLDMALIKISFDFKGENRFLNEKYQKVNVFEKYLKLKNENANIGLDTNKSVSIAGFPIEKNNINKNKLVIYNSNYSINPTYNYINLDFNSSILPRLKGPYYYMKKSEANFLLSGGASGAAVYQLQDPYEFLNWDNILPIGIYWGGIADILDNSRFLPSFLPFIFDNNYVQYDIFENFKNSFNKLEN